MHAILISLDYQVPDCDTTLSDFPLVIGSGPDAGIRLSDQSVSPRHCRIDRVLGQLVVCDLGSAHGTFVNGDRVVESPLQPGDTLSVGMLTFLVRAVPTKADRTHADPTAITRKQREEPVHAVV